MKYSETKTIEITAYCHSLSAGMVQSLIAVAKRFIETGKPVNVLDLDLTYNQKSNFQKLKFWELVVSPEKTRGYYLTKKGVNFLKGKIQMPNKIASMENKTLSFNHPCWETTKTKPEWFYVWEYLKMDQFKFYADYEYFAEQKQTQKQSLF